MFWIFVLCQWSDQFEFMALFVVLICGLVQILFFSLVVNFYFSVAIFLLLLSDLICFQLHILTSYCVWGAQRLRIIWSKGSTRLGAFLHENGNRAAFQYAMHLLEIGGWMKSLKKKIVSVNFHLAVFRNPWSWDQ